MIFYSALKMNEGVVGPSTIAMSAGPIYSCMGIAFVNHVNRCAGLYHYPAENTGNSNVAGTIRQMFNDVRPDEVLVTPAAPPKFNGMSIGGMSSSLDDILDVEELLGAIGAKKVTRLPGEAFAILYWSNGKPIINQSIAASRESFDTKGIADAVRNVLSVNRRQLAGNVWFYGGAGY